VTSVRPEVASWVRNPVRNPGGSESDGGTPVDLEASQPIPTAPLSYERRQVYGPFRRLVAPGSQDAATALKQVLSGEIWGKRPRWGISPAVKAYRGSLSEGDSGIEFWSFQEPDTQYGPRIHWSTEGPYVTIDDETETARLSVAFVRITQDIVDKSHASN
jgi:hypothetical protein